MTATTTTDIGKALGTDYFLLRSDAHEQETDYLDRTRRFVEDEVLPVMPGTGSEPSSHSSSPGDWVSSAWSATGSRDTAVPR